MDGQGRKGYLHYADNIGAFINSNWKRIIPYRKKTTAWINTIAGVLSFNCPAVFKSGTEELKEPGWWTLVNVRPPDPNQTTTVKGMHIRSSVSVDSGTLNDYYVKLIFLKCCVIFIIIIKIIQNN